MELEINVIVYIHYTNKHYAGSFGTTLSLYQCITYVVTGR